MTAYSMTPDSRPPTPDSRPPTPGPRLRYWKDAKNYVCWRFAEGQEAGEARAMCSFHWIPSMLML
jgi:hypothetical protein